MLLARIEGHATSTHSHASLHACRIMICQNIDQEGLELGHPYLAIDPLGAGIGSYVVVSTDGSAAQAYVRDTHSPLRNIIVAISDYPFPVAQV